MKKTGVILLLALLLVFPAAGSFAETFITSKDQLNQSGMKVGVSTGSSSMLAAEKEFPDAKIVYLEENTIAYESVAQGKIDAYVFEREQMQKAIDSGRKGVRLLDENLEEGVSVGVGISPVSSIPDLENRLNTFIREIKADGTLDDMLNRWVTLGEEAMPDIPPAQDPQIRLTVATSGIVPPYSYYAGTKLTGMDIELAYRFAAWLGADVTFKVYDYGAILPAAVTGEVDCIMANLNMTPERQEALPFSEELYEHPIGIMVKADSASIGGFLARVKESFNKTFIREDRWKLFARGLLTTWLITLLSVLCGTAAGFIIFTLCRNGNRAANAVTRFCTGLIQGMPLVVLLMILYYIVFSRFAISGIAVSAIGFTLTFGSAVFGLLKMGVGAVDAGQYEAACALGYSNRRTFYTVILPQALPHVMPSYKGEIVGLIKATSIVGYIAVQDLTKMGYIAVQDLTKMGDIVRSRTYEAFFPLIAVTVIYFALEALIGWLVSRISVNINPKRRRPEQILKGVTDDD